MELIILKHPTNNSLSVSAFLCFLKHAVSSFLVRSHTSFAGGDPTFFYAKIAPGVISSKSWGKGKELQLGFRKDLGKGLGLVLG